ncbi:mitochondrial peptide methionine sulfoxide reductase-like isoform X1 [Acipenser oxyrinchus oxyrinchus]|uniref:peptide-methionine (S)-S-oxide reductase n=1 Tax=Acipenser oxyrinchus oxyrinchus TaxID=40147 RepID=A0AAD8G9K1_ACIOX|nr:mitochondrial peptide methionine sulfoxide reductase-like isoform X1 [Acipenser oxyrinchus oxyrinchus]
MKRTTAQSYVEVIANRGFDSGVKHHINGNRIVEPFPEGLQMAMFAERKFWRQKGVYSTQVGYAGGYTPNPPYEEVCSGNDTGTQYRSAIYTYTQEQMNTVSRSKEEYQKVT